MREHITELVSVHPFEGDYGEGRCVVLSVRLRRVCLNKEEARELRDWLNDWLKNEFDNERMQAYAAKFIQRFNARRK
jgi:hypothetical protein